MSQTPIDTDLPLVNIERPLNEFYADALLVPMSQVSLKEVDIKELKEENEKSNKNWLRALRIRVKH